MGDHLTSLGGLLCFVVVFGYAPSLEVEGVPCAHVAHNRSC